MGSMESAISKVNQVIANYLESQSSLWEKYVSPREAYLAPMVTFGSNRRRWVSLRRTALSDSEPNCGRSKLLQEYSTATMRSQRTLTAIDKTTSSGLGTFTRGWQVQGSSTGGY